MCFEHYVLRMHLEDEEDGVLQWGGQLELNAVVLALNPATEH